MIELDDFKRVFGNVKVVSSVKCWRTDDQVEILAPIHRPVEELLKMNLVFLCKESQVYVCTNGEAKAKIKNRKVVMLEDFAGEGFDRSRPMSDIDVKPNIL